MRLYDPNRLPKDRLEWMANLLMLPVALGLFVVLRLAAPDLAAALAALVAAIAAVALGRGAVLFARRHRHSQSI
jgi:hypothetical protein